MTKKVVAAILLIAAVSIYLTWRDEGEQAFGGAFAPIQSEHPERTPMTPGVDPLDAAGPGGSASTVSGTDYQPLVDRVRTRTQGAVDRSAQRAGR